MTHSHFDLDHAIADWRRQLRAAGLKNPALLDELESHLREDVERQLKDGTGVPQAFGNAVNRIGHAAAIEREFSKVEEHISAWERKAMRLYSVSFPFFYAGIASFGLLRTEMRFAERVLGFMAVALCGLLIWCTPHYHKFLPVISGQRRRQAAQIAPLLLWMAGAGVFANFVLPQLNLAIGQITVAFLWLMTPTVALGGISYGLGEAARRRPATIAN